MSHCFACDPCCCDHCNPWQPFLRAWSGLAIALRNPSAARWLLGDAA